MCVILRKRRIFVYFNFLSSSFSLSRQTLKYSYFRNVSSISLIHIGILYSPTNNNVNKANSSTNTIGKQTSSVINNINTTSIQNEIAVLLSIAIIKRILQSNTHFNSFHFKYEQLSLSSYTLFNTFQLLLIIQLNNIHPDNTGV